MCRITGTRSVRPIRFGSIGEPIECDGDCKKFKQRQAEQEQQQDAPNNESKRSTVCAICGANTGTYNLNYGANTCLSCRAFFRRAIQKTRTPNFTCKFVNACEITEETRRCCKRCRFDRCVAAGMNAECVMKGEEIHQRFFKYIQRKKDVDKKASTMARLASQPRGIKKEKGGKKVQKPSKAMKGLLKEAVREQRPRAFFSASSPQYAVVYERPQEPTNDVMLTFEQPQAQQQQQPQPSLADLTDLFDLDLLPPSGNRFNAGGCDGGSVSDGDSATQGSLSPHCDSGVDSDFLTMSPSEADECDVLPLFEDVLECNKEVEIKKEPFPDKVEEDETKMIEKVKHARSSWNQACREEVDNSELLNMLVASLAKKETLDASILETLRAKHEKVFRQFACKQAEFSALADDDRHLLLSKNTQLFIQYVYGRVIGAATVSQQLQWLLLLQEEPNINITGLRRVGLNDLQAFIEDDSFSVYQKRVEQLNDSQLLFPCTGNVALVCLFQTEGIFSALSAPAEVARRSEFIYKCADWAHNIFNSAGRNELAGIMETLHAMVSTSESLNLVADCEKILASKHLLTVEEEAWIERRLAAFNKAVEEVSFGTDFVKECVMYSLGVPLSKHFIPQGTKVWIERYRRILYDHEEFCNGLSLDEQSETLVPATFAAFALTKAKLETSNCGNSQFHLALSSSDNAIVKDAFSMHRASGGHMPRLRRVSVREWNKAFGVMTSEEETRFTEIISDLAFMIRDNEAFKLMALLAMFTTHQAARPNSGMSGVAQRYLNALKRRFGFSGEAVKTALTHIKELSTILQHVSDTAMTQIQSS